MNRTEWLLLLALSLLWGGSFFFGKLALAQLPPLTLVLARVCLAAAVLHLVLRQRGLGLQAPWGPYFVMALLNNVMPFTLIFWGQTWIGAGMAAILNSTTPAFTVLLDRGTKLTVNRLAGVTLGVIGVVTLVGPVRGTEPLPCLAVLGAALSYALAGIYGRRFAGRPPLVTATGQLTAGTLLMAPLALLVDRPWMLPTPTPATCAAVLGLALASTALAYVVYFRILATAGPSNLLLVTLLIPVTALLLSAGLLGEPLRPEHLGGMAWIALGLIAIDGRLPRQAFRSLTRNMERAS